jgi:hypothetical protein
MFSRLPDVLIHIILAYTGKVSYRSGRYINRLCKKDERYKLLESIPLKDYNKSYNSYSVELDIFNSDIKKYFYLCSDVFLFRNRIYLLKFEEDELTNGWRSNVAIEYYLE